MNQSVVRQASGFRACISLPGDKSIAHRLLILSSISCGQIRIENFPANDDCLTTLKACKALGVSVRALKRSQSGKLSLIVSGKGLYGLREPAQPIFMSESGTTIRLLLGVLAGQNFKSRLTAGASLNLRPMSRVTLPLRMMGAKISAGRTAQDLQPTTYNLLPTEEYPPLTIQGGSLKPITYTLPVASAQVKSAILLAGLHAPGSTCVIEPIKTRDHTERLLKLFKADIKVKGKTIIVKGRRQLVSPKRIYIPGDISSASFFIVLAALAQNAQLLIKDVSLNPSRLGIVRVLKRMGANLRITNYGLRITDVEPMGDIFVKSSKLKGTIITREEIPSLIDELPILMVAASLAKGKTVLEDAGELRVKETDRIRSMTENLTKMGLRISVVKRAGSEDILIEGVKQLRGARVKSFSDHRTAMAMVISGLLAKGKTVIDDTGCINKSFPEFLTLIKQMALTV